MTWLVALFLLIIAAPPALAQSCGPDTAPAQAAAAGFTCETFRWGTGDVASEIDSGSTYAAPCANAGTSPCGGLKLYWSNPGTVGRQTLIGEYSVNAGTGAITVQTATDDGGAFSLNTCGGPSAGTLWTVGTFFQHGYYVEVTLSYDATGHPSSHTGFYGYDGFWYHGYAGGSAAGNCPTSSFNLCHEMDDPDALAFNQMLAQHQNATGGSVFQNNNNPNPLPNLPQTIESGSTWGMLSTATEVTWYHNGTLNGSPGTVALPLSSGIGVIADQYNAKECFGFNANAQFPTTYPSIKVFQAGPASAPSGGSGLLIHRR